MDKILIVKIGGKLINDSHVLHRFLKSFAKIKTKKICLLLIMQNLCIAFPLEEI